MKRGGNRSGKDRRGGGLNDDDFHLWREFTRDIAPLTDLEWEEREHSGYAFQQADAKTGAATPPPITKEQRAKNSAAAQQAPQLDLRTELRLRRGQMPIDARLDLHGKNQDQAHGLLNDFVMASHGRGKRCLLIITGKGKGGLLAREAHAPDLQPGILKQKVPQWLSMTPLSDIVLKTFPAVPRDGGSGALYVYLKRRRDYDF